MSFDSAVLVSKTFTEIESVVSSVLTTGTKASNTVWTNSCPFGY